MDAANLLQLATQIVFADVIYFSSFEVEGVRERSSEICNLLFDRGVERSIIRECNFDESSVSAASSSAATRMADDFQFAVSAASLANQDIVDFAQPELIVGHDGIGRVHSLITNGASSAERSEILSSALKHQSGSGAVEYMLASSDALLHEVRTLVRSSGPWTERKTQELIVHFRFYLNEELAQLSKSDYAPAVARARIMRKHSSVLMEMLNEIDQALAASVKKLRPGLLGVPSLANALVRRADGDPQGIIEEAVRARAKAAELRKHLRSATGGQIPADSTGLNEIRQTVRNLGAVLQRDLDPAQQPRLRDAFEVQFLGLVPIPNIARLTDWLEFRAKRRRVSILSEFSKSLADQRVGGHAYDKLLRRSSAAAATRDRDAAG